MCFTSAPKPEDSSPAVTRKDAAVAVRTLPFVDLHRGLPDEAKAVIADALFEMCSTVEQLSYVVKHASVFRSWAACQVEGLRQILGSRWKPKDGIEAGPTETFPEGIPRTALGLPEPERKQLPGARAVHVSDDAEMQAAIDEAARRRNMNAPRPPAPGDDTRSIEAEIEAIKAQQRRRATEASTRKILDELEEPAEAKPEPVKPKKRRKASRGRAVKKTVA